jgi:hypothetical protein
MKKIIFTIFLALSAQTHALELADVKLDENIQLEKQQLVLNGAGIRKKLLLKVYIGALYLAEKTHSAETVLADAGAKRMSFILLRDVSGKQVLNGISEAILPNNSEEEMKAIDARLYLFEKMFVPVPEIKKGEIVNLDYIPGQGTRVSVNGVVKGHIEGQDFYRSLLKIWVGKKPVQSSLKKSVLGEG